MHLRAVLVALATLIFAGVAHAADLTHVRRYVDGPWGQIHVRTVGETGWPTVVLLHQMVWSSVQYRFAQDELGRRGVRSIAVDIPGYGFSDGPAEPPTAAQYADALLPVLDAFKLQRAILLGTNTGATVVTVFADRHPARVDRLILEGVPVWDAATRAKLLAEPPFDQSPKPDGAEFGTRAAATHAATGDRLSAAGVHESVLQFFIAGPREWYAHAAVFGTDLAPILARVKAPVTVITYPGQELFETSRHVDQLRPDAQLVVLDTVGRSMAPSYDHPRAWADAVAQILRRGP